MLCIVESIFMTYFEGVNLQNVAFQKWYIGFLLFEVVRVIVLGLMLHVNVMMTTMALL